MSYTLIQTVTLTTGQANITFSSIPATFDDLIIRTSIRGNDGLNDANIEMRFNGSTSNYSSRLLFGTGSSANSATGASNRIQWASNVPSTGATANTFGSGEIYIPNYRLSSAKSVSITAVGENNATGSRQDLNAALWNDSAAITSIVLFQENGGNMAVGSSVSLYGVTRGSSGGVVVS